MQTAFCFVFLFIATHPYIVNQF